jgi:hypothetical protein
MQIYVCMDMLVDCEQQSGHDKARKDEQTSTMAE